MWGEPQISLFEDNKIIARQWVDEGKMDIDVSSIY